MNDYYKNIPGWFDYADIYDRAVDQAKDGAHFVEVGSYFGRSACYMAQRIKDSGKKIRFDCIDIFTGIASKLIKDKEFDVQSVLIASHGSVLDAFNAFMVRAVVREFVNPRQLDSVSASLLYADNSLDLVWIDADHGYDAVMADLRAWVKKVKLGGTFAGHDYTHAGVKKAVKEFFGPRHKACSVSSWIAL